MVKIYAVDRTAKDFKTAILSQGSSLMANPEEMFQCQTVNCGCIYDPDRGDRKGKIAKGTKFQETPEDWCCPVCGASKRCFKPLAGPGSVKEEQST